MLSTAWAKHNPHARERFRTELRGGQAVPLWYRTEDGWQAPLFHLPAVAGGTREPVVLAPSLGFNEKTLDVDRDRSLARFLQAMGFDVFMLCHRASQNAVPPSARRSFNFDDMVAHDVPAAIQVIKRQTGACRVHWVGHGLGGQLLIGHLAHDGDGDIASAVTIGAPVSFAPLRAHARRAAAVARWLPAHWKIPTQEIQDILTAATKPRHLVHFTRRIEGPLARTILIDGTEELAIGLMQQIALWHERGSLTTHDDRFDYTAALTDRKVHLFSIAAPDDSFCPPDHSHQAVKNLADGFGESWTLDHGWSHLDPIAGADAQRTVFPRIQRWLSKYNDRCWSPS